MNYHPPSQPLPAPCIIDSGVVIAKEDFNDEEQIRLKEFIDRLDQAGYKFILSNSDLKNFSVA